MRPDYGKRTWLFWILQTSTEGNVRGERAYFVVNLNFSLSLASVHIQARCIIMQSATFGDVHEIHWRHYYARLAQWGNLKILVAGDTFDRHNWFFIILRFLPG